MKEINRNDKLIMIYLFPCVGKILCLRTKYNFIKYYSTCYKQFPIITATNYLRCRDCKK
ncbi:MAG: hypothetical protein AB1765_13440 [Candidatus Hydrogenedentota bacterium]